MTSSSSLLYVLLIMGFTWVVTVVAIALIPYYTRKSIAFGVAVPPEQNKGEFLSSLRKHYAWSSTILGIVLALVSLPAILRLEENAAALISTGALLLYIVLTFVIFARCNVIVRDHKRNSDWILRSIATAELVHRNDQRKLFSPLWYLTHLALIALVAILGIWRYPDLPAQLPTQYDLGGHVTTMIEKSYWAILQMPLMMFLMTLLFAAIGFGINRAKRQTDDNDLARGLRNNRSFQIIMGQSMFWLALLMQAILAAAQLSMIGLLGLQISLWLTLILLLIISVGVVLITIRVGQGGYRLSTGAKSSDSTDDSLVTDDDTYWKFFGSLYNNPDDPSIFVEKRVGFGWTVNVGQPIGMALLTGTLALLVVLLIALPFLYQASQ